MCEYLQISRYHLYAQRKVKNNHVCFKYADKICHIFSDSHQSYDTRRIQNELRKKEIHYSHRKIASIMKSLSLKSKYSVKPYKPTSTGVNNACTENILQQSFEVGKKETAIVSDLSYVRVKNSWHYLWVMIQLSSREIISHHVGQYKKPILSCQR